MVSRDVMERKHQTPRTCRATWGTLYVVANILHLTGIVAATEHCRGARSRWVGASGHLSWQTLYSISGHRTALVWGTGSLGQSGMTAQRWFWGPTTTVCNWPNWDIRLGSLGGFVSLHEVPARTDGSQRLHSKDLVQRLGTGYEGA